MTRKKNFLKSRIVRWHMAFGSIGAALAGVPGLLTWLLSAIGSPEIQSALALLPERYRVALESATRIGGSLLVLSSLITMRERVKSDGGQVAGPTMRRP